ncbi:MAG: helix-turn-helix domain-containing protein [Vulcanimicrobiaceae bacterium]
MAGLERPFTKVDDELLERSDLSPGAKLLFARLSRYHAGGIDPSQEMLASKLGTDPRQVRRWLAELKACALIVGGTTNRGKKLRNHHELARSAGTNRPGTSHVVGQIVRIGSQNVRAREDESSLESGQIVRATTRDTSETFSKDSSEMAPAEKNETREAETPAGLVRLRERWSRRVATG